MTKEQRIKLLKEELNNKNNYPGAKKWIEFVIKRIKQGKQ